MTQEFINYHWESWAKQSLFEIEQHGVLCYDDDEENIFNIGFHAGLHHKTSSATTERKENWEKDLSELINSKPMTQELGFCHREVCKTCYRVNTVGFSVPDEVWAAVVYPHKIDEVHCLACFTILADEKLVEWADKIAFYPVSLRSCVEELIKDGDLKVT
jgi:hypothetical protein